MKIINQVIADGRYKDTWESLQQYHVPEWYEKLKFGIFIHWGVYSVPALEASGIPAICTYRGVRSMIIT